ncbi:hypothetical protein CDAR_227111 [Caerostris darwini]|uniref:Uncharacterized protein n=1 Tax=Caerostris darwini TaxID=1538125 RepID=A0AAV4PAL0_9ARAC|nr:hypothetical protein CDAR_227111 [Caerostris darwini]
MSKERADREIAPKLRPEAANYKLTSFVKSPLCCLRLDDSGGAGEGVLVEVSEIIIRQEPLSNPYYYSCTRIVREDVIDVVIH